MKAEIVQAIENQISRIKVLKRKKNDEIMILKREVQLLEEEQWEWEKFQDTVHKKFNPENQQS